MLWLAQQCLTASDIQAMLYQGSGLKGISGGQQRHACAAGKRRTAHTARDRFLRVPCRAGNRQTGGHAGGLNGLVFTAGIGANSPQVRTRICGHLADLFGISLDGAPNDENRQRASSDPSRVPVLVLPTDEEGMIALNTARILCECGKL